MLAVSFIVDRADMKVYTKNFDSIIDGIAKGIIEGFNLAKAEEVDELKVYKTLADIPSWGKATVQKLLQKGYINGTGEELNIKENRMRTLIIHDRASVYVLM